MSIIAVYRDVPKPPVDFTEFDFAALPIDPRITFTRASAGTYFDANGVMQTAAINEPRIDHDPVTGAVRGLLVEEQRTNLLLRSREFENSYWSKFGASVSGNSALAPDGTMSADKLIESASTGIHYIHALAGTLNPSAPYSMSIYARAGERSRIQIAGAGGVWGASKVATFDLATGQVVGFTWDSASITRVGGGWYRCTVKGTTAATQVASQFFQIPIIASGTTQSYTGDGTSGVYIWGAQVEVGPFPTSYIPTEGTAVTRGGDVANVTSGAAIRANKSAGTLCIEGVTNGAASSLGSFIGVGNNGFNAAGSTDRWWNGASNITSPPAAILGQKRKSVFAYTDTSRAISVNGSAVVQDNSAPWLSGEPSGIQIGGANGEVTQLANGQIRRLRYYPRRLSDAELQELTAP